MPSLPPAPHCAGQPLQVFPALLPVERQSPSVYPFGRWPLPAAGVMFTTPLSFVSVTMSPIAPGHVLIMPRSNVARLTDLPPLELADMAQVAQHVARVFERRLPVNAFSFAIQDGAAAGQTVSCVHMHLLPRKGRSVAAAEEGPAVDNRTAALASADPPPSGATAVASSSSETQHTALDPSKRIVKSRAEQAVEAREYAGWLQEAGVPDFLRSQPGLQLETL